MTKLIKTLSAAAAMLALTGLAEAREIRVPLDQSKGVQLPAQAAGVVVGNPTIAGVSVQNDRLIFVTGRAYGSTNVIVVGANNRQIYEARITVVPDESNVVMVTRGVATVRLDCNPQCRRRPDISDQASAFQETTQQITARAGGE